MEPVTPEAVAILALAMEHAGRLGHRYIGGEHLLLALASSGHPAGAALREHGVTPQRVEEEIVRHAGHGAGAGLFGSLDRDALAAIGIDLDTVRARIESSFQPDAIAHAGRAVGRGSRPARLNLRHPGRDLSAWLMRRWHRRRAAAMEPIPLRAATGLWRRDGGTTVFLPFTPGTLESLRNIRHEARAQRAPRPGTEHVALAIIAMNDGLLPSILSALGVSAPALRAAILDRCLQPS
jgi:Clp amino terminal domain, pathogenicity island component